ncbi:hypothetical protein ACFLY4_09740, partial [Chloroflexota bacterium]
KQEILCDIRHMKTVWLKHKSSYNNPLTIAHMRAIHELEGFNALRRNFQQTTFLIDNQYWNILIKELSKINS